MTTWWDGPEWREYEAACGLEPGTRVRERQEPSLTSQVVDLSVPITDLWRGVRKSYRSLINRHLHDAVLCHAHVMETFRAHHRKAAGRVTRPQKTWQLMQRWCKDGRLLLFSGSLDEAFAAFYCVPPYGYYGHASSEEPNVNHSLAWLAIRELKLRNVRWLEMGYLDGSSREVFRRGFGGEAMTTVEIDRRVTACGD